MIKILTTCVFGAYNSNMDKSSITKLRKSTGLTVEQFAKKYKFNSRTFEGWEQGRQPGIFNMMRLRQIRSVRKRHGH